MKNMISRNKSFESEYATLNVEQVEEIYVELREGTSFSKIGKMFDVSTATVQNVNKGKYFRVDYMTYPIVDRRRKYLTEPGENDEFWDWFVPEPYIDRGI
jgi:transposase